MISSTHVVTLHQTVGLFAIGVVAGALNSVAAAEDSCAFPRFCLSGFRRSMPTLPPRWPFGRVLRPLRQLTGGLGGAPTYDIAARVDRSGRGRTVRCCSLRTPQAMFMRMVPWLTLLATVLFAFSGPLQKLIGSQTAYFRSFTRTDSYRGPRRTGNRYLP